MFIEYSFFPSSTSASSVWGCWAGTEYDRYTAMAASESQINLILFIFIFPFCGSRGSCRRWCSWDFFFTLALCSCILGRPLLCVVWAHSTLNTHSYASARCDQMTKHTFVSFHSFVNIGFGFHHLGIIVTKEVLHLSLPAFAALCVCAHRFRFHLFSLFICQSAAMAFGRWYGTQMETLSHYTKHTCTSHSQTIAYFSNQIRFAFVCLRVCMCVSVGRSVVSAIDSAWLYLSRHRRLVCESWHEFHPHKYSGIRVSRTESLHVDRQFFASPLCSVSRIGICVPEHTTYGFNRKNCRFIFIRPSVSFQRIIEWRRKAKAN